MPARTLIEKARRLRPIQHYFGGVAHGQPVLPSNLLLFHRSHRRELPRKALFHHRWVLLLNLKTPGIVEIDRHTFSLGEGQAVLIFPHQFHFFRDLEREKIDWLFLTFELRDAGALRGLRNTRLEFSSHAMEILSRVTDRFLGIRQEMGVVDNKLALLAAELLEELLQSADPSGEIARMDRRATQVRLFLDQVHSYIFNHISGNLSLRELAKQLQISESGLRSLFRRHTGTTLGRYIRECRLMKASGLLHNADMTISEIAEECGFSSVYAFSRAFRHMHGLSPSRFRSSLR